MSSNPCIYMALWLQAKVRDPELRLYTGSVCDDSVTEAVYAAVVVLCE